MPSINSISSILPWNWGGTSAANPQPLILKACGQGDLPALQKLLATAPADLLNTPLNGELPLHVAIGQGQMEIVKLLIENGAKPGLKDGQELSAYDYVMLSSSRDQLMPELLACVIGQKVEASMTVLQDPQKLAELHSLCEKIKEIAVKGAQVTEEQMKDVQFPAGAVATGQAGIELQPAKVLPHFMFGFGLDKKLLRIDEHMDAAGNTLLHFAAAQGNEKLLKIALEHGIDLNLLKNKEGQTPLHFACAMESSCIKMLVNEAKMGISQNDGKGISPLALVGACADKKNPLNLSRTQAVLATLIAAEWVAHYALNPAAANYALLGLASLSQLTRFAEFLTMAVHWPGTANLSFAAIWIAGRDHLGAVLPFINIASTVCIAKSAFEGVQKAWKNKSLNPLKALRNVAVYGINFAGMAPKLASTIDWGFRYFRTIPLQAQKAASAADYAFNCPTYRSRHSEECRQIEKEYSNIESKIERIMNKSLFSWVSSLWGSSTAKSCSNAVTNNTAKPDVNLNPNELGDAKKILAAGGVFEDKCYEENEKEYINNLYRPLVLRFHPDKCPKEQKDECEIIFRTITEARKTLLLGV